MAELAATAPAPPWLLDRVGHVAQNKYDEAVTTAVGACAAATAGQTCYICHQALHRHTKEGLVRGCACHTTEGFVHLSCLAEQASMLVAEALEKNNLDRKVWDLWHTCGLCKQRYHGEVLCALGWACWRTYLWRPEWDRLRGLAMNMLGDGLRFAEHHEDALSVYEAQLSMLRRLGGPGSERSILITQGNLANTHQILGRLEEAGHTCRDIYRGCLKLNGEEDESTIRAALNCATSFISLQRFEEAKSLIRKMMPVALRVLGQENYLTLQMRWNHARTLSRTTAARAFDDIREAVTTLEETERTMRRVLGGAHPSIARIEEDLRNARAALRAREEAQPSGDA